MTGATAAEDAVLGPLTGTATIAPAKVFTVLWHDAVYGPTAPDNEQLSAELARWQLLELGVEAGVIDQTVRLVTLTAGHRPESGDADGALLCDADLAVLAAEPDRYRCYAAAVRKEYAHVLDPAFQLGRAAVLRELLEGGIYRTAGEDWEDRARRNVLAELAALDSAGA